MHMFPYTVTVDGSGRSKVNPNADDRPIILIYTFTEAGHLMYEERLQDEISYERDRNWG